MAWDDIVQCRDIIWPNVSAEPPNPAGLFSEGGEDLVRIKRDQSVINIMGMLTYGSSSTGDDRAAAV